MLLWRPWEIKEREWPYIFFLKLNEGKLTTNSDFGTPIQHIDDKKIIAVTGLEIANK